MPQLDQLTSRDAVLAAIEEFDVLGREAFLQRYGYGSSKKFFLVHEGRLYDSKAILAAAWQHAFPDGPALESFSGGPQTTSVLQRLGFDVVDTSSSKSSPLAGLHLARLHAALRAFRNNPVDRARVRLRRYRAAQIRDGFAAGAYREPEAFERNIWRMLATVRVRGEDWPHSIFHGVLTPEKAAELERALDDGAVEIEGNSIWHPGSPRFAPHSTLEERRATAVEVERIVLSDAPTEDKHDQLMALPGIGECVATGLGMIFEPARTAIYNAQIPVLVEHIGGSVTKREHYEAFAPALAEELGAEDFLELDWFLWQQKYGTQAPTKATHLNEIFYGPPGTGKTFLSAARAVEIIDGSAPSVRDDVEKRFRELQETNQVSFVTFHQSYSYEEFVEGIRPVLAGDSDEDRGSVDYECRPGVFRALCEAARAVPKVKVGRAKVEPRDHRVWKISLGNTRKAADALVYEDAIESGHVALGYGRTIDFTGADDRAAVEQRLREHTDGPVKEVSAHFVHRFKNEMAVGDLVVVSDGNHKFRAIGQVTGDYRLLDRERYAQSRPVQWLRVLEESLPSDQLMRRVFSQATFYELNHKVLKLDALRELLTEDSAEAETKAPQKNYVLIIDEINRGNVAKILGELITLLEPDKRLGAANELRVKLPYSQEEFGVPSNVYVIGTMNTADRSIAFLDTALRRRFRFEEMMPDLDVIREHVGEGGVIDGVDVAQLVDVLNRRIELLYDRDHTLGHAYFLKVASLEDLRDVLVHRVLPLLQEYFYDDWEKVCVILGCPVTGGPSRPGAIIRAEVLSAEALIPGYEAPDEKARFTVEPDFLSAAGPALVPYFAAMVNGAG